MQTAALPLKPAQATALLHALPCAIALEDGAGTLLWLNRELAQRLGLPPSSAVGKSLADLPVKWSHDAESGESVYEFSNEPETPPLACRRLPLDSGFVACLFQPEPRPKGSLDSIVSLLHGRMSTDSETGTLDRASIMRVLQSEVSRSRRYANPLSVVYLRVKPAGPVGDTSVLMASAASCLRDETRWADNIGRYAPDAFLLVLPETEGGSANAFIDKLHDGRPTDAGYSWQTGLAQWTKGEDATFLIERAKSALRQA